MLEREVIEILSAVYCCVRIGFALGLLLPAVVVRGVILSGGLVLCPIGMYIEEWDCGIS